MPSGCCSVLVSSGPWAGSSRNSNGACSVCSCGSAITSYTSSVADSWVNGEGVAGAVWTRGTTTHGSAAAAWLGRRRGRSYGSQHCSSWPSVIWRQRRRHASTCPAHGRRRHVALLEREKQRWNGWWTTLLQLACLFCHGRNQRGERATGLLACGRSRRTEGDGEVAHGAVIGALACCAWC